MNLTSYDWKKEAAQQVVDADTVERAFMDQAYGFLSNKAGKLMQDPHRLGFEVVYKNDTNTRMVGIFAFRVNDQILYAPVFFLNGEIKGTDLLYRQETKTFVPLNEEWVSFLTEKSNYEPGQPTDRKNFTRTNNTIRFEEIAYPPNTKKSAGELIHKFIVEDGGAQAIEKIASWMGESFEFAEALVSTIEEKDYMPSDLKVEKKAAAKGPSLVLFTGRPGKSEHSHLLKTKEAAEKNYQDKLFSKGYCLWDDRAPSDITPLYRDATEEMEMVGNAGMYDVLMRDGSFKKAIVAPKSELNFSAGSDSYGAVPCCSPYSTHYSLGQPTYKDHIVCLMDGEKETTTRTQVYGKFIKDQAQMVLDGDLEEKAKSGKAYCILDTASGCLTSPIYIKSVKEKDGVYVYEAVPVYGGYDLYTIRHNTDVPENDITGNFLGKDCRFVPVATDEFETEAPTPHTSRTYYRFRAKEISSPGLGSADTLNDWVSEHFKKAACLHDKETDTFSWRNGRKDQTHYMPRVNMAVKLASAGFHAEAVEVMLDETEQAGRTSWYYGDPEMSKSAFPKRLTHSPDFRASTDSEFNVNREDPQSYVITTDGDEMDVPESRVGDAYDPAMGRNPEDGMSKDQLMTMSPEQIAQFASSNKLPNVFEHGMVGSMVQVYDSLAMIDKYLPDMEEALDRLGRILFLFYWKPRDFEEAYGSDDMTNLENQIMSNFKSFGTLVLDLMKRSKKRKLGNVSLGS